MRATLLILLAIVLPTQALGVPIDAVIPAVTRADGTAQMTVVAIGLGSGSDIVRFPGDKDAVPFSWGTDYVRVVVPATWSGDITAFVSSTGQWTDEFAIEVTYSWNQTQWETGSSTWKLHEDGAPVVGFDDTLLECQDGYDAWSCNSDFTHNYVGSTSTLPGNLSDGENVLGWTNSGWSPSGIAVCTWKFLEVSGNILEFDVAFNSQHFNWGLNDPTKMDVQNIVVHELGHSIGFLDQYGDADFDETMYGWSTQGETLRRTLHLNDVIGAEVIYGHTSGRANLTYTTPAGWYGPLSPANVAGAPALPPALNGNVETRMNVAALFGGGDCVAPGGDNHLIIDEVPSVSYPWSQTYGSETVVWANRPLTVRGGLHQFELEYDVFDDHVESDETDNYHLAHFAYTPEILYTNVSQQREYPPRQGIGPAPSCDGFVAATEYWGVVGVMTLDSADDYDVYLYDDDVTPLGGFRNISEQTFAGGNATDFAVVNGNVSGYQTVFNAGAVQFEALTGSDAVIQASQEITSTSIPADNAGQPVSIGGFPLFDTQILLAHEIYVPDTTTDIGVLLEDLPDGLDLSMAVFGPDQATYNQYEDLATLHILELDGDEYLRFAPPAAGFYLIVVYKPTSDGYGVAGGYNLSVARAPANIAAGTPLPGWDYPVVPRQTADADQTSAALPAVLVGNTNTNWVNMVLDQQGPATVSPFHFQGTVDGVSIGYAWFTGPVPMALVGIPNQGAFGVRGGRHTIGYQLDHLNVVFETDETDNEHYEQFVWSPLVTAKKTSGVRPAPPDPGIGLLPNSDGLEYTPSANRAWVVAGAELNPGDDFDLVAYDDYSGSTNGFSNELHWSSLGANTTEFVVGHSAAGVADVYSGMIRWAGAGDYAHDQTDAQGNRRSGPFEVRNIKFGANRLVEMYSLDLTAGETYSIKFRRVSGADDMSFELFAPAATVTGRGAGIVTPDFTLGETQYATFVAPASGWHPLVLYRTDGTEASESVFCDLHFYQGILTAAPDPGLGTQVSFAAAQPNPAPGQTMLRFALPNSSRVRLDVYDLRGRRVRSLIDETMPAGRHQTAWDGRDQRGSTAASGVYILRLSAGGQDLTRRVTIVR